MITDLETIGMNEEKQGKSANRKTLLIIFYSLVHINKGESKVFLQTLPPPLPLNLV